MLVLLWAREGNGFRIVAYDVEEAAEPTIPFRSIRASVDETAPRAPRTAGDPGLIEAATRFHQAWLLDQDLEEALLFFTEDSFECLRSVSEGAMGADRSSMLTMLEQVSSRVAARDSLASAIRTIEPRQPDIAVVAHPHEDAFTLVPVTDGFGDAAACGEDPPSRDEIRASTGSNASGRYSISYFQLNLSGDPAFLWMLWTRGDGAWAIRYWTVVTP